MQDFYLFEILHVVGNIVTWLNLYMHHLSENTELLGRYSTVTLKCSMPSCSNSA